MHYISAQMTMSSWVEQGLVQGKYNKLLYLVIFTLV